MSSLTYRLKTAFLMGFAIALCWAVVVHFFDPWPQYQLRMFSAQAVACAAIAWWRRESWIGVLIGSAAGFIWFVVLEPARTLNFGGGWEAIYGLRLWHWQRLFEISAMVFAGCVVGSLCRPTRFFDDFWKD